MKKILILIFLIFVSMSIIVSADSFYEEKINNTYLNIILNIDLEIEYTSLVDNQSGILTI